MLGSIHTFDPLLGCDATTFQPCSDRALSNLRSTLIPFRKYPINKHIPVGKAIAAGRYIEDVYYGGNPWYLNTLAVSEQLYDAIYVWKKQAHIVVTDVSLAFWRDLVLDIKPGFYPFGTKTYGKLLDAAAKYADGFVDIVSTYVGDGGSMSEQYTNSTGCPISARHLTWSYSAFLSATDRRAGRVGRSWAGIAPIFKPSQCGTKTIKGTYKTATPTAFPAKQTPKFGHH